MADIKITGMSAASTPLVGTELLELVQSGSNVKVAASDVAAAFATDAANILPVANGGTGYASVARASYYSVANQTGDVTTGKAVLFASTSVSGAGISVANNGSGDPTRVTAAGAGTYQICASLQFDNSGGSDYDATIWMRLNGTDVTASSEVIVVPKASDGGSAFAHLTSFITLTAGQYIEIMWLPENAAVTLDTTSAVVGPPAYPAKPSASIQILRIA